MTAKTNKKLIKSILGVLILVVGGYLLFMALPTLIVFASNTLYLAFLFLILVAVIYGLIRFFRW